MENLKKNPSEQEQRIATLEAENAKFVKEIEGLALAKANASAEITESSSELTELRTSQSAIKAELEDLKKVAASRKELLNNQSTEKEELVTQHKAKYTELEKSTTATIKGLEQQLAAAQSQSKSNADAASKVSALQVCPAPGGLHWMPSLCCSRRLH